MALRAASPFTPFWYAPEGQEGEPTRFKIRGLTGLELSDVNAGAKRDEDAKSVVFTATSIRTALRQALLDWEGFEGDDGKPVEFSRDIDKNIARLPFDLLGDLFGEILKASRIDGEQVKN